MTINLSTKVNQGGTPPLFNSAIPFQEYKAGLYYHSADAKANRSTGNFSTGLLWYVPFGCIKTHTFTGIGIYNSNAAQSGVNFYLGLYDSTTGFLPGNLLVSSAELTLDATTAFRVATISQQLQKSTLYWLAFTCDATMGVEMFTVNVGDSPKNSLLYLGRDPSKIVTGIMYDNATESHTYGALPATATPTGTANSIPALFLKG